MCCSVNADTFAMCRHGAVLISAAVQNDELDIKAESFLVPRNKSDKDALLMGGGESLQDARMPLAVLSIRL